MYEIPLSSEPNQSLQCTIPVDGKNLLLNLEIGYNSQGNYWMMTVKDKDRNTLVSGIPMLCARPPATNILRSFKYLKIGSAYVYNAGNKTLDSPDSLTLGSDFILVWSDTNG